MQRGQEFIGLYNRLDTHLRNMIRADGTVPFTQLVNACAGKNTPVRRYSQALRRFGDLRNAIIHYRDFPPKMIAEPSEDITDPPKVYPRFKRDIRVFEHTDPLMSALTYMREHDFSQVVVHHQGLFTLLTAEGVADWLREQAVDPIIDVTAGTVGAALAAEQTSPMLLLSSRHTLFDAEDAFVPTAKCPRLYAIIITAAGKNTETPLGLITPWDILRDR